METVYKTKCGIWDFWTDVDGPRLMSGIKSDAGPVSDRIVEMILLQMSHQLFVSRLPPPPRRSRLGLRWRPSSTYPPALRTSHFALCTRARATPPCAKAPES